MQHAVCYREISAAQDQPTIGFARGDEGKGAQISDADPHSFQLQRAGRFHAGAMFSDNPVARLIKQVDPVRDEPAIASLAPCKALGERRAHPAALSVTKHHDLPDVQLRYGKFHCG